MKDVTEECVAIVRTVQSICGNPGEGGWSKNYTYTHIADIFKGSANKKVMDAGMQKVSFLITVENYNIVKYLLMSCRAFDF